MSRPGHQDVLGGIRPPGPTPGLRVPPLQGRRDSGRSLVERLGWSLHPERCPEVAGCVASVIQKFHRHFSNLVAGAMLPTIGW